MQPLHDYARQDHIGTVLFSWDSCNPYLVLSLALVDDMPLVFDEKDQLHQFLNELDLYKMASNGTVNVDKTQMFRLAKLGEPTAGSPGGRDVIGTQDSPFCILGDDDTELIHLGQPLSRTGSVPLQSLEKRLQQIQAKVNVLSTSMPLMDKVQICNTFLLSKLWHAICTCPISKDLQRRVNWIIHPFLFLG